MPLFFKSIFAKVRLAACGRQLRARNFDTVGACMPLSDPQQHSSISPCAYLPGSPTSRSSAARGQVLEEPMEGRPHRADALPIGHRLLQHLPSSGAALGGARSTVGSPCRSAARGPVTRRQPQRPRHRWSRPKPHHSGYLGHDRALHVHARADEPLRSVALLHVRVLVILVLPSPGAGLRPGRSSGVPHRWPFTRVTLRWRWWGAVQPTRR